MRNRLVPPPGSRLTGSASGCRQGHTWLGDPCLWVQEAAGRSRQRKKIKTSPFEKVMLSPLLRRRMETLPLIVLSWDFHTSSNLMCLDVLAAGHSWRERQLLWVLSVFPGGSCLSASPTAGPSMRQACSMQGPVGHTEPREQCWGIHSAYLLLLLRF